MRALLLVLTLCACGEGLPLPYLIADLRILAVRAEPPEGPAGTDVALEALVASPDDGATDQLWFACPALVGVEAATMPCAMESAVTLGTGATASARLPEGTPQLIVTTGVAAAATGGLEGCLRGFEETGAVPDGCRIAVKRVNVLGAGETPNRNPTVSAPSLAGEQIAVEVSDPDGDAQMFLSWYVTAGELDRYRTDVDADGLSNEWTPAGEPGRVIVVVRDGRGGEAWAEATR